MVNYVIIIKWVKQYQMVVRDWDSSGMNKDIYDLVTLLQAKFNVGNFNPINTHFANYNGTYLQGGLVMC